jgi:hypothetical protein
MSSFISNIESINSGALQTARVEDAHTNDAIINLLGTIYTATPNAVIVQMGVEWKNSASLFQAWALYYNPDVLPTYPANQIQILASNLSTDNYLQVGQYSVINNPPGTGLTGDYFCVAPPDLGAGIPFTDALAYYTWLGNYIPDGGWINITWQDGVTNYKTSFTLLGYDNPNNYVIFDVNSGDSIPAAGNTNRYGVSGTN